MNKHREYKSFYGRPGGGEGERCKYPVRLDLYGCGCQHDCKYCYAKQLLKFRKLWDPVNPRVADMAKVAKRIPKLEGVTRLGGLTDCLMPLEREVKNTWRTLGLMAEHRKEYLIVTKSSMIASADYLRVLDRELAHIQISISTTSEVVANVYEKASPVAERIAAAEMLESMGYDVSLRLSPLVPGLTDYDVVNAVKVDKVLVEFLRGTNAQLLWYEPFEITKTRDMIRAGGYWHFALDVKKAEIAKIKGHTVSVCEDVPEHYAYWRENVNRKATDCCNLRR